MIELCNVSKRFGAAPAVCDFSLKIESGAGPGARFAVHAEGGIAGRQLLQYPGLIKHPIPP